MKYSYSLPNPDTKPKSYKERIQAQQFTEEESKKKKKKVKYVGNILA